MSVKRYLINRVREDDGLIGLYQLDEAGEQFVHIDVKFVLASDYDAQSLELQAVREALELAHRHIDMEALRVSHCNAAAQIDAALKPSRGA